MSKTKRQTLKPHFSSFPSWAQLHSFTSGSSLHPLSRAGETGNGGLWSVHYNSSLLFLPHHTFHLLQCGFCIGYSSSWTYSPALVLVFCGLHGILALAFHHGLQGSRGVHALSVEHLLLRPWCVLCCSRVFQCSLLFCLWGIVAGSSLTVFPSRCHYFGWRAQPCPAMVPFGARWNHMCLPQGSLSLSLPRPPHCQHIGMDIQYSLVQYSASSTVQLKYF